MQSKMLNSTLINKWNAHKNSFDANMSQIETYEVHPNYDYNHYLFLKRELEVTADTWNEAKRNGVIRHCKLYRGKFLDYVVHKEFDTIEEWVADAGGKMEDVLYGEHRVKTQWEWKYDSTTYTSYRVPYKSKYVELSVLLKTLGYVEPPKVDTSAQVEVPTTTTQDLTEMLSLEMRLRGLTIDNVYVLNGGAIVPWKAFVSQ